MSRLAGTVIYCLFPSILLWLFVVFLASLILAPQSDAHSPTPISSFLYPTDCCGTGDCRILQDNEYEIRTDGYFIFGSKELIPFNRVRPSPDGFFHRCMDDARSYNPTYGGNNSKGHCFWIPGSV